MRQFMPPSRHLFDPEDMKLAILARDGVYEIVQQVAPQQQAFLIFFGMLEIQAASNGIGGYNSYYPIITDLELNGWESAAQERLNGKQFRVTQPVSPNLSLTDRRYMIEFLKLNFGGEALT
jgi:hypothetical protein